MSSLISSHGVVIATAMAAVSGTVFLLAVCRQKPLSATAAGGTRSGCLRSCISSERKEQRKTRTQNKRVHFAKDVTVKVERENIKIIDDLTKEYDIDTKEEVQMAERPRKNIPANRVALYHGMLRDRSRRTACSH